MVHARTAVQVDRIRNPIGCEAQQIIMTVSPAFRDPSRAGKVRSPCRSPELLTALESAIDVPNDSQVIAMDLARIANDLCSFLQIVREKYVSERAV